MTNIGKYKLNKYRKILVLYIKGIKTKKLIKLENQY